MPRISSCSRPSWPSLPIAWCSDRLSAFLEDGAAVEAVSVGASVASPAGRRHGARLQHAEDVPQWRQRRTIAEETFYRNCSEEFGTPEAATENPLSSSTAACVLRVQRSAQASVWRGGGRYSTDIAAQSLHSQTLEMPIRHVAMVYQLHKGPGRRLLELRLPATNGDWLSIRFRHLPCRGAVSTRPMTPSERNIECALQLSEKKMLAIFGCSVSMPCVRQRNACRHAC